MRECFPRAGKKNRRVAGCLRRAAKALQFVPMKFVLAILVFLAFAFFISWGVLLTLQGQPWLLAASLAVFLGTFIRFGCQSH